MSKSNQNNSDTPTPPSRFKKLIFWMILIALTGGTVYFYLHDFEVQNQIFKFMDEEKHLSPQELIQTLEERDITPILNDEPTVSVETSVSSESIETAPPNETVDTFIQIPTEQINIMPDEPVTITETISEPVVVVETVFEPIVNETMSESVIPEPMTQPAQKSVPLQPAESVEQPVTVVQKVDLTPLVRLRQDVMFMRNCSDSFQQALPLLSAQTGTQLLKLCSSDSSIEWELKNTFNGQAKLAAPTLYTITDNSWKGILKSWVARFIRVRALTPRADSPTRLLDLAQLELDQKQVEKAVQTLEKLPSSTKIHMIPFIERAYYYLGALQSLDETMTHLKQENKHD